MTVGPDTTVPAGVRRSYRRQGSMASAVPQLAPAYRRRSSAPETRRAPHGPATPGAGNATVLLPSDARLTISTQAVTKSQFPSTTAWNFPAANAALVTPGGIPPTVWRPTGTFIGAVTARPS